VNGREKMNPWKNMGLALIGLGILLFGGKLLSALLMAAKIPTSIKFGTLFVIIGILVILISMVIERGREKKGI